MLTIRKLPFLFLCFMLSEGLHDPDESDVAGNQLQKNRVRFVELLTSKVDAICPLLRLRELEDAGKQDLQAIEEFNGPGDKRKARQESLKFWRSKMEELITPFVTKPEELQGKLINFTYIPSDPSPSDIRSTNYRSEYNSIKNLVKSTSETLERDYAIISSRRVDDLYQITQDSWWKFETGKALQMATFNINLWGQKAKHLAAAGKPFMPFLRQHVEMEAREFNKKAKRQ